MIPACRWGVLRFPPVVLPPPARFSPKALSTVWSPSRPHANATSPAHFPDVFAAAGGERTHSHTLRACTRWRIPPTSTQRKQVGPAFRSWLCRGEAALECGNLFPLSGLQPPANTPVRASRSPNSDLRSPTPRALVLEIVVLFPSAPSASSCFILSFVFALGVNRDSTQEPAKHIEQEHPRLPAPCFIRGGVLHGPTRLRFDLARAGASPIQARSASKWIRRFGAPRFGFLTDPLACASTSYALARPPLQARSASKWVPAFRSWLCRGEAALECGNLFPLSGLQPPANTPVRASRCAIACASVTSPVYPFHPWLFIQPPRPSYPPVFFASSRLGILGVNRFFRFRVQTASK